MFLFVIMEGFYNEWGSQDQSEVRQLIKARTGKGKNERVQFDQVEGAGTMSEDATIRALCFLVKWAFRQAMGERNQEKQLVTVDISNG